jgi:hypothetical protein
MSAPNVQKTPLVASVQMAAQQKVVDAMALLGKALPSSVTAVNGDIVTVQFEVTTGNVTLPNVTIPKAESPYLYSPTQVGDVGLVVPSDVYIGGISGLGGGTADLSLPGNLSALVWIPVSTKSFTPDNANAAMVVGPQGAIIRDAASDSVITLTPTEILVQRGNAQITMTDTTMEIQRGSQNIIINSSGVTINGSADITLNSTAGITLNGPIIINGTVSATGGTLNLGSTNLTTTGTVTSNGKVLSTHTHSGVTTGSGDTGPPV